jgi:peroxiredoxin
LGTRKQKIIFSFFSVLILAIGFWLIFFQSHRPPVNFQLRGGPKIGEAAPDFLLSNLDGNLVHLGHGRGKVIFLNFWATWCPPCKEEMPSMESLYQKLKDQPFEMLAVSIDEEGRESVQPFMEKYSLTFSALLDRDKKIAALYGITGIPETFIMNKRGLIDAKIIGPQNWTEKKWRDYFDRLIGEKHEAPLPDENPAQKP